LVNLKRRRVLFFNDGENDLRHNLGRYFVLTGGYCEGSGLTDRHNRALLFISDDGVNFRQANEKELSFFADKHPILHDVK